MKYEWSSTRYGSGEVKVLSVHAPRILLPFEDAILAAGPDMRLISAQEKAAAAKRGEIIIDSLIWQAEPLYRGGDDLERVPTEVIVNLVPFDGRNLSEGFDVIRNLSACFWPSSPRDIFSICAHQPELYKELGSDPVAIVTPDEKQLDSVWRVPCVWLGSAYRQVAFIPSRYPFTGTGWLAFRARFFLG